MLKSLKIAHKVYVMGIVQVILVTIVGFIGYSQMAKIGEELESIANQDIPITNQLSVISEHGLQQAVLFERLLYKSTLSALYSTDMSGELNDIAQQTRKLSAKTHQEIKDAVVRLKQSASKQHSQEATDEFNHLHDELAAVEKTYNGFAVELEQVISLVLANEINQAADQAAHVEELQHKIDEKLLDIVHEIQRFTLKATQTAERDEKSGIAQIAMWLVIALVFSLIMPYIISKAIVGQINELNERLFEVAQGDGDLTVSLPIVGNDETTETARALNLFISKLRGIITDINQSATKLDQSSQVAIEIMGDTLERVERQQGQTEQVASAVTQMNATTQEMAQNTDMASSVADNVKIKVSDGNTSAVAGHSIIEQLSTELSSASTVITQLADRAVGISAVIEAIQGIAEQTNLLALNAAIEAARAGETGRGFAVVADEVRNLAQRTQRSTMDIQELVEGLQSEAKNAVSSMNRGSNSADLCLGKSLETTEAFESAAEAVRDISELNSRIASATKEQSETTENIDRNLVDIQHIARVTSEGARKTSDANIAISKGLIELHTILQQFKV